MAQTIQRLRNVLVDKLYKFVKSENRLICTSQVHKKLLHSSILMQLVTPTFFLLHSFFCSVQYHFILQQLRWNTQCFFVILSWHSIKFAQGFLCVSNQKSLVRPGQKFELFHRIFPSVGLFTICFYCNQILHFISLSICFLRS